MTNKAASNLAKKGWEGKKGEIRREAARERLKKHNKKLWTTERRAEQSKRVKEIKPWEHKRSKYERRIGS